MKLASADTYQGDEAMIAYVMVETNDLESAVKSYGMNKKILKIANFDLNKSLNLDVTKNVGMN